MQDLTIYQHKETPVSILSTPWQYLKPLVYEMGLCAKLAVVSASRTMLKGCSLVDVTLMAQAASHINDGDANIIKMHTALGRWDVGTLQNKIGVGDGKCGCGAPNADMMHRVFHCPRLQEKRDLFPLLKVFDDLKLPDYFKLGFVGDCPLDVDQLFPNGVDEEGAVIYHTGLTEFVNRCGFRIDRRHQQSEVQANVYVNNFNENNVDGNTPSGRPAIARTKGMYNLGEILLPAGCEGEPPDEPNVYADGSVLHPSKAHLQQGSVGAWVENRDLVQFPQTEMEGRYHSQHLGQGLATPTLLLII